MKIAFDPKLRRPGCAILQTAFGGTIPSMTFGMKFPSETWLLAPTPAMGLFEVTEEELELLAGIAQKAVKA